MKRIISLMITVLILCSLVPISSSALTHWRQYFTEEEIRALIPKTLKTELKKEYGIKYDISKTKYTITEVSGSDKDSNWFVSGLLTMYDSSGKYATSGRFYFKITAIFDTVIVTPVFTLYNK